MALLKKVEPDFATERKRMFARWCMARKLAPFHKDKKHYADLAWAEVDAYLDWLELNKL